MNSETIRKIAKDEGFKITEGMGNLAILSLVKSINNNSVNVYLKKGINGYYVISVNLGSSTSYYGLKEEESTIDIIKHIEENESLLKSLKSLLNKINKEEK